MTLVPVPVAEITFKLVIGSSVPRPTLLLTVSIDFITVSYAIEGTVLLLTRRVTLGQVITSVTDNPAVLLRVK